MRVEVGVQGTLNLRGNTDLSQDPKGDNIEVSVIKLTDR